MKLSASFTGFGALESVFTGMNIFELIIWCWLEIGRLYSAGVEINHDLVSGVKPSAVKSAKISINKFELARVRYWRSNQSVIFEISLKIPRIITQAGIKLVIFKFTLFSKAINPQSPFMMVNVSNEIIIERTCTWLAKLNSACMAALYA